jgi:hypothetical protein
LQSEKHGEQTPNDGPDHTRDQELLRDRFMILAEHIFGDERLFVMMMLMVRIMHVTLCICHNLLTLKS